METKYCTGCKKDILVDEFSWRSKTKGTRQSECKKCLSEKAAILYITSETRKENIRTRTKQSRKDLAKFVNEYKEMKGCERCKEKYEYYVLDLHHLEPEHKDDNVSVLLHSGSKKKVEEELKKCIVVCANCHRIIHHEQRVP